MNCLTIVPYPNQQPEIGLSILMAAHLNDIGVQNSWVRCNGMLSVCDYSEGRKIGTCQSCMSESRAAANWVNSPVLDLGRFITPDIAVKTHRWAVTLPYEALTEAKFQKTPLFPLCEDSIKRSLGAERVAPGEGLKGISGEQMTRQVLLQAARAEVALGHMIKSQEPDIIFTTAGHDYFSRIIQTVALENGVRVCALQYESMHHMISVRSLPTGAVRLSPLIFENVLTLRRDGARWPIEVKRELDELLIFLGIEKPQLSFAFSRAG